MTWSIDTDGSGQNGESVQPVLHPTTQKLKNYIEGNAELIALFAQGFQEIPREFQEKPDGHGFARIHDYRDMIKAVDRAIKAPPLWTSSLKGECVIGCPINEAIIWLMNTKTGSKVFLREDINDHFAGILNVWAEYLSSPASVGTLNDQPRGWLSKDALKEILEEVNSAFNSPFQTESFEEVFECQPSLPSYGFKSWDEFFSRHFRPNVRPVASPSDSKVLVNPCESQPLLITPNVPRKSQLWLKGTSYSLTDMLGNDPSAEQFVGGTVYQGWLSVFNYHRWHAPTSGRIAKILQIRGTYFAGHPSRGFENLDPITAKSLPDRQCPDASQRFISSVATRTVVLIEADDQDLGLVGFVAIGMCDVSSCVATVALGEHVEKGQGIGSFHYGGSSYCLLVRPGVKLEFSPVVNEALEQTTDISSRCIAINSELARFEV